MASEGEDHVKGQACLGCKRNVLLLEPHPVQRLQAECSDPGAPQARKTQEGVAGCAYRRHGYWYG
jgi:hypothetical protein